MRYIQLISFYRKKQNNGYTCYLMKFQNGRRLIIKYILLILMNKAKIRFFSAKSCSFIQLFEELDHNNKGYLDYNDLLCIM